MPWEAPEAQERRSNPATALARSRWAALATAAALVAVALVPAAAPTASAQDGGDVCVPSDDPYDVGLVLDRSGSMSGSKIDAARTGGIQLVENLTFNDQSGLVSYSSSATLDDELGPDHESTAQAIDELVAGGGTATGSAIDESHQDFQTRARAGAGDIMILLTDGKTNAGPDPIAEADEAKADGIEIYAIGVGSNVNEQDLKTIASDPVEDHYFQANDSDEIVEVFQNLTGIVGAVAPYDGEAYGVDASATSDDPKAHASLHEAPRNSTNASEEATAVEVEQSAAGYTVEASVLKAETGGDAGPANVTATSRVGIEDLTVTGPSGEILRASSLASQAHVWAAPDATGTEGTVLEVTDLELPDPATAPAPEASIPPNTEIALPGGGTLTLNEQIPTEEDGNVTFRVNLLHLEDQDGDPGAEIVVGSAYAAAACSEETSFGTPQGPDDPFGLEAPHEGASAGPASVQAGGCAEGEVAASATGCSEGEDLAVSGTDEARNRDGDCGTNETCVAASGIGDARNADDDCEEARACVAASGTGEAQNAGHRCSGLGTACVAASGTGPADNTGDACPAATCVGVSGTDDAEAVVAASGTGDATGGVAASGTGDAEGVAAASGTGTARGLVAVTGTGTADGSLFAAGVTGTCNGWTCNDVNPTGPAEGHNTAVSGNDSATARQGAAVSGTDEAFTWNGVAASGTDQAYAGVGAAASGTDRASSGIGAAASGTDDAYTSLGAAASGTGDAYTRVGVAVSGTEDAYTSSGAAASGTGHADGLVAVTGTGSADGGLLAAGVTGTCNGWTCNDANPTGPAQGHNTAVSATDDAEARQGAAVSGTDDAYTSVGLAVSGTDDAYAGTGVGVSGCHGVDANLAVIYEDVGSPAPVCGVPAAGGAGLLP